MAKGTPDQIAAKWASRLSGATDQIKQGVQAVNVAPGQAAARQQDAWAANVAAAKGKWASRVASVSLADWQNAVINKGVSRVAAGATAAQPKMQSFMSQLLPYIESGRSALPARGNLEQNIARSAAWARHMANFTRR